MFFKFTAVFLGWAVFFLKYLDFWCEVIKLLTSLLWQMWQMVSEHLPQFDVDIQYFMMLLQMLQWYEKFLRKMAFSTFVAFIFSFLKKSPVEGRGNLMFSQRNNPYCDLLHFSTTKLWIIFCFYKYYRIYLYNYIKISSIWKEY